MIVIISPAQDFRVARATSERLFSARASHPPFERRQMGFARGQNFHFDAAVFLLDPLGEPR
jgi:hypothetical protein